MTVHIGSYQPDQLATRLVDSASPDRRPNMILQLKLAAYIEVSSLPIGVVVQIQTYI